jgi:hypothetical protein
LAAAEKWPDGPLILLVCLVDQHQRTVIDKENVLRVDGGKALTHAKMHRGRAGVHCLEPHTGEEVNVIVTGDPDATRSVLKERKDQCFLNAVLRANVVEFGSIVLEKPVLGCNPEQTVLVLNHCEDVQVAQSFVLPVVAEVEVLSDESGMAEEAEPQAKEKPAAALQGEKLDWSAGLDQFVSFDLHVRFDGTT